MSSNFDKQESKNLSLDSFSTFSQEEENSKNLAFNYKLIIKLEENDSNEKLEKRDERYSIDATFVPKAKLQEYLTSDLLDELDNSTEDEQLNSILDSSNDHSSSFESDHESHDEKTKNCCHVNYCQNIPEQNEENSDKENKSEISSTDSNKTKLKFTNLNDIHPFYPKNYFCFPTNFNDKRKRLTIREGDWKCYNCHNINFSFRDKCNRCGKLKSEMIKTTKKE